MDLSITLDHNIAQNLHFFIFNNTLRSMFILFFTSYQVLFPTKFLMNLQCYCGFSCTTSVPTFVLTIWIVVQSCYQVFRFFSESGYYQQDTQHQLSNIFLYSFPQPQFSLWCYICLSTSIQTSIEFWYHFQWQTQPCACTAFHIRLLHTSCIRPNGCSNISFCTNILQPLTMCKTFSTCVPYNLHLFETSL